MSKGEIVVATLRRPEALASFAKDYPSTHLLLLPLDVTKFSTIQSAFAAAIEKFGRVDVVVNNAGAALVAEAEATPEDAARNLFEINFFGMATITREAVRVFREVNKPIGGSLLQIASEAGVEGWETLTYYSAR